jgi:hypothetical protein
MFSSSEYLERKCSRVIVDSDAKEVWVADIGRPLEV